MQEIIESQDYTKYLPKKITLEKLTSRKVEPTFNFSKIMFIVTGNAIQALNTPDNIKYEYENGGLLLSIAGELAEPIHILYYDSIYQHNTTIHLEKDSKVSIIEHVLFDNNEILSTEVYLAPRAQLQHCLLQDSNILAATHLNIVIVMQAQAQLEQTIINSSVRVSQIIAQVFFKGEQASSTQHILNFAQTTACLDAILALAHEVPFCKSKVVAHSVVQHKAQASIMGKIKVAKNAQKTNANLQIKNLLCDKSAKANARPQLEIYADDVKCAHGATTGTLDPQTIFYMRSRGIGLEQAKQLLMQGFMHTIVDNIKLKNVRTYALNKLMEM